MSHLVILAMPTDKGPQIMAATAATEAEATALADKVREAAHAWASGVTGGYPGTVEVVSLNVPFPGCGEDLESWADERLAAASEA